jgi:hypothetical protein
LQPGDFVTIAGVYQLREDWLSRVLRWFGIWRHTGELAQFRIAAQASSASDAPHKSTPNAGG